MRKYSVVDSNGNEVWKASKEEVKRLARRGQAVLSADGRVWRLLEHGKHHEMRTIISSGGVRAAMGMSQDYTATERGQSHFKKIYPEDRPAFSLDALFRDDPYEDKGSFRVGFG